MTRSPIVALATAAFAYGFLQSSVTPLLPTFRLEHGVTEAQVAWLVTGYLLTASAATPIVGRLGDVLGRARVLRIVLLLFLLSAVAGAVAPTFTALVVARFAQGIGAAIFPLAYGLIRDRLPTERVAGAIGVVSAHVGIGGMIGIVSAGWVAQTVGSQAIFALGAVAIGVALALTRRPERGADSCGVPRARIDIIGALLMLVWTTSGLAMMSGAGIGSSGALLLVLAGVSAVAFAGWIIVERRAAQPIVDLRLAVTAPVVAGSAIAFAFGFIQFALMVAVPAFVQADSATGFGFSANPVQVGLFIVPQTIAFLGMNLLTARTSRWPGSSWSILLGSILAAITGAQFLLVHQHAWQIVAGTTLTGVALGAVYSHLPAVLALRVKPSEVGSVTGMNITVRNIGAAAGAQVTGLLLTAQPGLPGFSWSFLAVFLTSVAAIPAAVVLIVSTRDMSTDLHNQLKSKALMGP